MPSSLPASRPWSSLAVATTTAARPEPLHRRPGNGLSRRPEEPRMERPARPTRNAAAQQGRAAPAASVRQTAGAVLRARTIANVRRVSSASTTAGRAASSAVPMIATARRASSARRRADTRPVASRMADALIRHAGSSRTTSLSSGASAWVPAFAVVHDASTFRLQFAGHHQLVRSARACRQVTGCRDGYR